MERISRVLLAMLIGAHFAYLISIAYDVNVRHPDLDVVHIDFVAFWAAAKLALAGDPVSAFDWPTLARMQRVDLIDPEAHLFWLYPPAFLLLVMPLGLLPFTPALAIYNSLGLVAYWLATRRWLSGTKLNFAVAAPAVAVALAVGNTALPWAAGLVLALSFVRDGRPIAAGLVVSALTMKPQLGLMIPIALLFGGHYRVFAAAAAGTAVILAASTAVFGVQYWIAFAGGLSEMAGYVSSGRQPIGPMITWYALLHNLDFGHAPAMWAQGLSTAVAAVAVAFVWSRDRACVGLRAATLCFAILLSSGYAYQYELVIAVAGAFILADGDVAPTRTVRSLVACVWSLPLPAWLIPGLDLSFYCAPVLTLCLFGCVQVCAGHPREAVSPAQSGACEPAPTETKPLRNPGAPPHRR